MNIKVILFDKITEKYAKEGIKEYEKRLSRYCKIKMEQVKNYIQLIKQVNERTYLVLVSPKGQGISSMDLASKLSELGISGNSDVTFLLSPERIPREIEEKVDFHICISKMDMDINIEGMIIYEQVYRAFRIISGEPYHK